MGELYLYRSDIDTVIAHDERDAADICRETYGEEDFDDDTEFALVAPEKPYTLLMDDHDVPATVPCESRSPHETWKGMTRVTLPASEWVARIGRGFLGSTEW